MLHVFLVAAAESSKVPFYIAGGLLAAWAVLLSAVGITHPEFPGDVRGQRGIILVSLVLMVAALAMAIVTA